MCFITILLLWLTVKLIELTLPRVLTHAMVANNCNSVLTTVLIFCSRESLCKLSNPSFLQIKITQLNVRGGSKAILAEGRDLIYRVRRLTPASHTCEIVLTLHEHVAEIGPFKVTASQGDAVTQHPDLP